MERALAFDRPLLPSLLSSASQAQRRISDVQISRFRVQLSAPPTTKGRTADGAQFRNGLLVRVNLRGGAVGTGEIAPLESLHEESLEGAEEQFGALRGALIGRSVPGTLPLLGGAIATWLREEVGIEVSGGEDFARTYLLGSDSQEFRDCLSELDALHSRIRPFCGWVNGHDI